MLTNGDVTWELRRDLLAFALETARAARDGAGLPPLPERTTRRSALERPPATGRFVDPGGAVDLEGGAEGLTLRAEGDVAPLERIDRDRFVSPLAGWDRFDLVVEREDGEAVRLVYGSRVFGLEGRTSLPPPTGDPSWAGLTGRYRGYGIEPMHVFVHERAGRLRLVSPGMGMDDELVPLADGRFRVGSEPWQPGRARFETIVGDRATRAVLDGASFTRVP